jgi:hypothetical protein
LFLSLVDYYIYRNYILLTHAEIVKFKTRIAGATWVKEP